MSEQQSDKIESVKGIDSSQKIVQNQDQEQPDGRFSALMQQKEDADTAKQPPGSVTPIDLATQSSGLGQSLPTKDTLNAHLVSVSSALGNMQKELNNKKESLSQLKSTRKALLRNRLSNANQLIRNAASKLGVDVPPLKKGKNGLFGKLVSFMTDGQTLLGKTQNKLKQMTNSGKMPTPPQLLLIQVQLSKAEQEMTYASMLLGKVVDDIKQMFNIQI